MGIFLGGLADYAGFSCPEDMRHREFHSVFKYDAQLTYPETALCLCTEEDLPVSAPLVLCCDPAADMPCADGTRDISEIFQICCDYLMYHNRIDDGCARLSSALLSGKGISYIIDTASKVFGNPILLADQSFKIIACSGADDISDPFLQNIVQEGFFPESYIKQTARKSEVKSTSIDVIPPVKSDGHRNYMVMDLEVKGRYFGFATLVEESPFRDGDNMMFSYLCRILVTELRGVANQPYAYMRDSEYVLLEMLDNKLQGRILQARISQSGLSFSPDKKRLLVLRERNSDTEQKLRYEFLLDSFFNRLQKSPCVIYRDAIVCLIDEGSTALFTGDTPASLTDLLQFYNLICGISNEIADPRKLSMYYEQALNALTLAERLKDPGLYFFHENYSVFTLLDLVSSKAQLSEYCSPRYMQLLKYDSRNDTNYAATLSAYLECGHDSLRTAEKMHVHRNTIIYRLKRLEELFGIRLDDADELFSIHFTLKILRYLGVSGGGDL